MHGAAERSFSDDLTSIVGDLEWAEIEGGFWSLRFGDDAAPHGGSVVLGRPDALHGFQHGQRVHVTGRVAPATMSIFMAGTMYELQTVERATQE